MIVKRRTEVTFERVVRSTHLVESPSRAFCNLCADESAMLAPEEAAAAAGVSSRTIYRWVEEAKIHFRESASGSLVVCPRSVLEQVRTT